MIGSIEWRGKDKDYARLAVSVGVNAQGQAVKKYKSIGRVTPKEAEKALAAFIVEIESGLYLDTKRLTLAAFVDTWLTNYAETSLRPRTLFRYKNLLTTRILPEMGHLQMTKITPLLVASFYRKLQEEGIRRDGKKGGLSGQTILHHHRLLHTIFEFAVRWQVIQSNPVSRTPSPKVPRKEAVHYEEDEIRRMLQALSREPFHFQVLVIMAIETGMRESELMGLLWAHVDLEACTVKVEQTRHYVPRMSSVISPPKTELSRRMIAITPSLARMLAALKERQESAFAGNQADLKWVFISNLGRPIYAQTMSSWFPRFLRKYGLPHLRFHGLRHTSATLLNAKGLDIASLSKRLGHSTKMTTLNIYTHSFANADYNASRIMEEVLSQEQDIKTPLN